MSMIVTKQPKGTVFLTADSRMKELFVILSGSVAMKTANDSFVLKKGSVIGLAEYESGKYMCDYEALEETLLVSYALESKEGMLDIFEEQPQYIFAFLRASQLMCQMLLERYKRVSTLTRELYLFSAKQNREGSFYLKQYIPEGKLPENLAAVAPVKLTAIPKWQLDYFDGMMSQPVEKTKEFYKDNKALSAGTIYATSILMENAINAMVAMGDYIAEYTERLISDDGDDYFAMWFEILKAAHVQNVDCSQINDKLTELINFIIEKGLADEAKVRQKESKIMDFDYDAYVEKMTKDSKAKPSKAKTEDANKPAPAKFDLDDINFDIFEYIICFAEDDEERKQEYRQMRAEYARVALSNIRNIESAEIKKRMTDIFFEIYTKAFLKSLEFSEVPTVMELFFNFGMLDPKLVGNDNIKLLLALNETMKEACDSDGVYTTYQWIKSIYDGENTSSKNEFGLDYPASLRELRKANKITADDEKFYKVDKERIVRFEIDNMIRSATRGVSGNVIDFTPVLAADNLVKDPALLWVSPDKLKSAIAAVKALDFSCFYREVLYYDKAHNTRMNLQREIMPSIIMAPIFGVRAMMWQECGVDKESPARFIYPIFSVMDINESMLETIGRYRWEICRKIQGMRWNDISEHSLTSDYYDYLSYYKKNKDISTLVKDKIKIALTRAKGNFREVFVVDYVNWLKYESKGNFRVNKTARKILSQYVPFIADVRYGLLENPLFKEVFSRYENKMIEAEKKHKNAMKAHKDHGGTITSDMMDTLKFYQM